jgi:3-oxoacyl-[acyl-carrier-protein] synthase II
MNRNREVVVTGVGLVCPIGIGWEDFCSSLREQRSGVGPLAVAQGTELPVQFGAEVKDFDPKQYVKPRKSLKVMSEEIRIGYSAAIVALQHARLEKGAVEPERIGVVFGSEMFYCDLQELANAYRKCVVDGQLRPDLWGESAMSDLYPLWMLKYLPNMVGCHIAIAQEAWGPNNTITLDEVSGLLAFIEATSAIERGTADVMIAGGVGTRINLTRIMYRGDTQWSHRGDDPQGASRPFDAERDGGVIGEGAGAFVLETREHAEARGATVFARVLGYGRGYERSRNYQLTSGDSIRHSIRAALQDASLQPADVGHVNAHGASTLIHDRIEAQAIRDCLEDTPVTALKSYFGCLGAGSGPVEMAGSVMALAEGHVPVTLNYRHPDPQCPVNVIHDQPAIEDKGVALVVNQSETGQSAAVLLGAP